MTSTSEIDNILYLLNLSESEGNQKMKGKIRPISRQRRCHVCNEPFEPVRKLGFMCKACQTHPKRFRIDLHWNNRRVYVCSDKTGQALDTYERAFKLLASIQTEIDNHTFDPTKYVKKDQQKFLFGTLIESWLADKEKEASKGKLSWSYIHPLKGHINNYILPFFQGKDIRDIRTIDIKEFYKQLPDRLSAKTQKNILDEMRNFFNRMIEDEVIEKKPIFPKVSVPEPEIKWCNRELQDRIINGIPDKHRFIFFFLSRQGVRPGEAIALKWGDIDFKNGILTVKRTMSFRQILERTKTKKIRPRLLHPDILDILLEIPRGLPNNYIFINPNTGRPYMPDTIQKIWRRAAEDAGSDITLYQATRHSVASMAATSGVSIQIIKEVLGHTDIRTTQKYAHLDVLAHAQVFEAQKEKEKADEKPAAEVKKLFTANP